MYVASDLLWCAHNRCFKLESQGASHHWLVLRSFPGANIVSICKTEATGRSLPSLGAWRAPSMDLSCNRVVFTQVLTIVVLVARNCPPDTAWFLCIFLLIGRCHPMYVSPIVSCGYMLGVRLKAALMLFWCWEASSIIQRGELFESRYYLGDLEAILLDSQFQNYVVEETSR